MVVLITGASSGFGRLAAERLARRGSRVFATMRDTGTRNAAACADLEALAAREQLQLEVLDLDVTSDASVDAAATTALARAGGVDVLIDNAGYANWGLTEAYTADELHRMFDTNVYGPARMNRALLSSSSVQE